MVHVKVTLVMVDSILRFGSAENFNISLLECDPGKKSRLFGRMIQIFAEKGREDFYGTKEQLNDTEDFYPFVASTILI